MDRESRHRRLNDLSVSRALREDAAASMGAGGGGEGAGGAPDLCASILMRVDDQRAFLSGRDRRRVHIVRWSLGALLGVMTLASALAIRFAPEAVNLGPVPQPASRVIAAVQIEADQQAANLRDTLAVVSEVPTPRLSVVVAQVARGGVGVRGNHPINEAPSTNDQSGRARVMILSAMPGSGLSGLGGSGGLDARSLAAMNADRESSPANMPSAGCFVGPFRACRPEIATHRAPTTDEPRSSPTLHTMAARLGCVSNCRDFNAPAAASPAGTSWLTISNSAGSTITRERVQFVLPEVRFGSMTPISPTSPSMADESIMPR